MYQKGEQILNINVDNMALYYDDGGRKEAGFEGPAGDCFVRAISIACELDYKKVWDQLDRFQPSDNYKQSLFNPTKKIKHKTPDKGVRVSTASKLLGPLNWKQYYYTVDYHWDRQAIERLPFLDKDEIDAICNKTVPETSNRGRPLTRSLLPKGRCIAVMNSHVVAIIDHKIYDAGTMILGNAGRSRFVQSVYFPVTEEPQVFDKEIERTIEKEVVKVNRRRKLTDNQIHDIRHTRAFYGTSYNEIGRNYGISGTMVYNICKRNVYKHVD